MGMVRRRKRNRQLVRRGFWCGLVGMDVEARMWVLLGMLARRLAGRLWRVWSGGGRGGT